VADTKPETTVEVTVVRDKAEKVLKVAVSEQPEARKVVRKVERDNALKGVSVQDLTPDLRSSLNIPDEVTGVVVAGIASDSVAQGLITQGDVIQQVNGREMGSVRQFEEAASGIKAKDTVLLLIYRNGGSLYLTIKP